MKIYTKTGDFGQTSLLGKNKVNKSDLRVDAYGDVDELNSMIGVAICHFNKTELDNSNKHNSLEELIKIQNWLFNLGSQLATLDKKYLENMNLIEVSNTLWLEKKIDEMEKVLPTLKNFILPGGSPLAAHIHLARTICRRAERKVVKLNLAEKIDPLIITFLNRLSDYLFVKARYFNKMESITDVEWQKET